MSLRTSKTDLVLTLAGLLCLGCDADDREIEDRGDLILSGPIGEVYRLERRVEQVPSERIPPESRPSYSHCGYLTERAAAEIDRAVAELDPEAEYAVDIQACEREWRDGSSGRLHIEGFTHGPFICGTGRACCAEELRRLAGLYQRVLEHLVGNGERYDEILEGLGIETYPVIEPDEPCR